MIVYNQGVWFSKSQERKNVRDEVREAFWAEAGAKRHQESRTIEYAPQSQRVSIVRLMQVTRDACGDQDLTSFLAGVAKSLASVGIGKGAMGGAAQNVEDLSRFHTLVLEHFFTLDYKFEGPRDGGEAPK